MLVYGHRTFRLNVAAFLAEFQTRLDRLPPTAPYHAVVTLLVDWGEAEAAVADALLPDRDDELEQLAAWRAVGGAIADAACASRDGDAAGCGEALARGRHAVGTLSGYPADVQAKTAEGFAHFALYPEQYIEAARRCIETVRPASLLCVGLRSIGSTLAHVVAAAVRLRGTPAWTRSVRPRGHPFDRHLDVTDRLRGALVSPQASHIAVVDEGPGLSGSSMAAAADFLVDNGVPASRVLLFPSWQPRIDSLRSPAARAAWTRHPIVTASFEEVCLPEGRLFGAIPIAADLSAGAWRARCFSTPRTWPAVHPQHERRKYLGRHGTVFRFVGLGRRGASLQRRAEILSDAGFTPPPLSLTHGFLEQPWIDGAPLTCARRASTSVIHRLAAYLALVGREFRGKASADVEEVANMALINAGEALGGVAAAPIARLAEAARPFFAPSVGVDGRMLPHEWIQHGDCLVKTDALDHHDDDFWPGSRDIAWDVAGVIAEFGLSPEASAHLVETYERASGDRSIRGRLPLQQAGYLAYRHAYAALAADTLGDSPDGHAFKVLRRRYRRLLRAQLVRSDRA